MLTYINRAHIILFSLFVITLPLEAQSIQGNLDKFTKAPIASILDKFGNIPVSLYTGVPNISIPIYNVHYKDIDYPIALSYNASGIKVNEESGPVGLGWILSTEGIIYRNIKGMDDLIYGTGNTPSYLDETLPDFTLGQLMPVNYYDNGYDLEVRDKATLKTLNLTPYFHSPERDFQPDEFSINLPGLSTRFIINRKGDVILTKEGNVKIKLLLNNSNRFLTTWVVTTADGTKYYFNDVDRIVPHPNAGLQPEYISAWHLSKIVSAAGTELNFTYKNMNYDLVQNNADFYEQVDRYQLKQSGSVVGTCPVLNSIARTPSNDYRNKILDVISSQNGKMIFYWSDRSDKKEERKIDMIKMFSTNGTLINYCKFNYDYFKENTGGICPPFFESNLYTTTRLKLVSVDKNSQGPNIEHYEFEYDENSLPPKYSLARDHWGYFNGQLLNTSLIPEFFGKLVSADANFLVNYPGANRDPIPAKMQAFILKKIKYPTGGSTSFTYESHDFDILKSDFNYLKTEYEWTSGNLTCYPSAEGNVVKTAVIDIPTTDAESDGYVRLQFNPHVLVTSNDPSTSYYKTGYFKLRNEAGVIYGDVKLNDRRDYQQEGTSSFYNIQVAYALVPGRYYVDLYLDRTIDWIMNLDLNYRWIQLPETFIANNTMMAAGGLRIKKIVDYDPINDVESVCNYQYNYQSNGKTCSYGRLMSMPRYDEYMQTENGGPFDGNSIAFTCNHFLLAASSNYDLFSGSGLNVGYDQVIVSYSNNSTKLGKQISYFNNESDGVYNYPSYLHPPGLSNSVNQLNGELIKTEEYKYDDIQLSYSLVSSKEYSYTTSSKTCFSMFHRNIKLSGDMNDEVFNEYFFYPVNNRWLKLDLIIEKDYSDNQKALTKTTQKIYSSDPALLQLKKEIVKNSEGIQEIVEYYYASDFSAYANDDKMKLKDDFNFVEAPIEIIRKIKKGNDEFITGGEIYDYRYIPLTNSAQVFLDNIKSVETNTPIPLISFTSLVEGNTPDGHYNVSTQMVKDFNNGTLTSITNRGNEITSYIWGNNKELPLGKCLNAVVNEIYYTGFESDGTLGNAHNGLMYHKGDYSLNFVRPNSKQYFYSYWYFQNGLWYFSGIKVFTNSLTITDGENIDDVRVFPEQSKLYTYHYYPSGQLASITDENDDTNYYEYDLSGRLILTRSDDKSILNQYVYHIIGN